MSAELTCMLMNCVCLNYISIPTNRNTPVHISVAIIICFLQLEAVLQNMRHLGRLHYTYKLS